MKKQSSTTLACFTPFVMAVTVILEVLLALYVFIRYKNSAIRNLSIGLLVLLAVFQAAEYGICEGVGLQTSSWAHIGYVAITLMPLLGLHLVYSIIGKTNYKVLLLAYATGFVWIGIFSLGSVIDSAVCDGNYVIFNLQPGYGGSYFAYYFVWLIYAAGLALRSAASKVTSKHTAFRLRMFALGYAVFAVPGLGIWLLTDDASRALPSIMCGFAVVFAVMLVTLILPEKAKKQKR